MRSRFDSQFERDRRNLNIFFRVIVGFCILAFCAIIAWWGLMAYAAITVLQDPSIIGEAAGKVVEGFERVK